jgi:hypothetical protein
MTLLFHLDEWHVLAKLRMQTEHTLKLDRLNQATAVIGQELPFREWTREFNTLELSHEMAARERHKARKTPYEKFVSVHDRKLQVPGV